MTRQHNVSPTASSFVTFLPLSLDMSLLCWYSMLLVYLSSYGEIMPRERVYFQHPKLYEDDEKVSLEN